MARAKPKKDTALFASDRKRRKIKAAQIRVKELRTGKSVPMTWAQSVDYANYMAEVGAGPVMRDLEGRALGPTEKSRHSRLRRGRNRPGL